MDKETSVCKKNTGLYFLKAAQVNVQTWNIIDLVLQVNHSYIFGLIITVSFDSEGNDFFFFPNMQVSIKSGSHITEHFLTRRIKRTSHRDKEHCQN